MKQFEYKLFTPRMKQGFTKKTFDMNDLNEDLKNFGIEGWELVTTIGISGNTGISWGAATAEVVFVFKRLVIGA